MPLMETFQYNTWIQPDTRSDPARSRSTSDPEILDPAGSGPHPQNPSDIRSDPNLDPVQPYFMDMQHATLQSIHISIEVTPSEENTTGSKHTYKCTKNNSKQRNCWNLNASMAT